jgi:hypothetical protein
MLCPFAVVERFSHITQHSYGILKLTNDAIGEEIRALGGCKMSLFLNQNSSSVDAFLDTHNIEIVLCKDGLPVTMDIVMYGTALLKRRMPVCLLKMSVDPCQR